MSRINLIKQVELAWRNLPVQLRRLPVIIGVSGGLDSSVLADISIRLRSCFTELHWAHVNYHLRNPESDREAAFLQKWAGRAGVPLHVRSLHPKAKPANLQSWARRERHALFAKLARQFGKPGALIWLAHHQQDQAETILIRLLRGSNLGGLGGMSVLETLEAPKQEPLHIFRPLLEVPREAIQTYAERKRLRYFDDKSNREPTYLRNRIRHQVLPLLKRENPRILENFQQLAKSVREADRLLTQMALKALVKVRSGHGALSLGKFRGLRHELMPLVLKAYLADLGIAAQGWARLLPKLTQAIQNSWPQSIPLGHQRRLEISEKSLRIAKAQKSDPVEKKLKVKESFAMIQGPGDYRLGVFGRVQVRRLPSFKKSYNKSNKIVYLDSNYLTFPLKIRRAREGDRFQPLGMVGSKGVRRFLMDRKIPKARRDVLLLTNARGVPIWVIGHRIDERAKVSGPKAPVLRVAWYPEKQ